MSINNDVSIHPDPAVELSLAQLQENFSDIHPPLTAMTASIEADRCYYCFDAPCTAACPTSIDIPLFIRQIYADNLQGAAKTILDANIMGGMCARVCPTENLCEGDCVRNLHEDKPVAIGLLQRHATDSVQMKDSSMYKQLFDRQADTGKKIAVVGAGPAGMACAHKLATLGNHVMVFEAAEKAGGLNEYGIAAYKTVDDYAQKEIDYIMEIGGIELKTGQKLGRDISLSGLQSEYDAVFLGTGLAGVRALGVDDEASDGVANAVDYIATLRQADDLSRLDVGNDIIVIGGGMTAIDIAVQSKRLGAKHVSIIYRRGPNEMGASDTERRFAENNGVMIYYWSKVNRIITNGNAVSEVEFEYTSMQSGTLKGTGEVYTLRCDHLFKAVGQLLDGDIDGVNALKLEGSKLWVDGKRRTSVEGVWAGGDCINNGYDLAVAAVEDGKVAAMDIHHSINVS